MDEFSVPSGLEVEQIWVRSSTLRLVFAFGAGGWDDIYLDLTDFRFTDAANAIRVEDDPLSAGPVPGVLHRRVRTAQVRDRELAIAFDTVAHLTCLPQAAYEAWATCLPGECW